MAEQAIVTADELLTEARNQLGGKPVDLLLPRLLDAQCVGTNTQDWFPEPLPAGAEPAEVVNERVAARQACGGCRVQAECLLLAVNEGLQHGIWGGTTAEERVAARRSERDRQQKARDWSPVRVALVGQRPQCAYFGEGCRSKAVVRHHRTRQAMCPGHAEAAGCPQGLWREVVAVS